MTDDEAKDVLELHRAPLRGKVRTALNHALTAMGDREVLVVAIERNDYPSIAGLAARRHMKGEE